MNDLVDVLVRYGYLVVFGWVFAEQIGLPIPAMPVRSRPAQWPGPAA